MRISAVLLPMLWAVSTAAASIVNHPNRVINLPGAPLLPEFPMYAGFLNGSSGGSSRMFYVLVEAIRVDPSTAPLVVWFNGGPGGSSLQGFFLEHGPYRITEAGDKLVYHELSWNQYANVMYVESPIGVGFSRDGEGNWTINDRDAAELNFHALKDFMTRVHPNYANRDFYLSGQSYAGAYVPHLSRRLLNGIQSGEMPNKNFKGFAIGSPILNRVTRQLAMAMQYISYGLMPHSYIGVVHSIWEKARRGENVEEDLREVWEYIDKEVLEKTIGWNSPAQYNLAEHCYNSSDAYEKYHGQTKNQSILCVGGNAVAAFMNRPDVQNALHIGNMNGETKKWNQINIELADVQFERDVDVRPVYNDIFRLVNGSSFRVLIYNGDTDAMLPPLHAIIMTEEVANANDLEDQHFDRAWRFFGDFGGIRKGYRQGNVTMDMLTVRGGGHSVPTDLPAQAFQLFNNFILTRKGETIEYSQPIQKH